ncbi:right-handed parallel beta-helix repeat-containing protein [Nitrospirillum bahiense]|uniref:Parallel beta helix pectate lyase-like protein n=1 Tax=Nitrospirillum amazonense TaxID=28077 RepID=A0A560G739_9PROT|nr:right-handed parallel beta-helix repeat-containing protein [Nitrospirillum amazonense]TWB29679.1 parallel beta helix pectate lyase-like protein [Nitrospirillum amazonense]
MITPPPWPRLLLAGVLLLLPGLAAAAEPVTFHVAPGGDDSAPGTKALPFRTLVRAQAAVRTANRDHDVMVELAAGTYALDKPLVFAAADGGQGDHHVVWRAAAGAGALISGGMRVTGWTLADAENDIYVADVPKGLDSRQLWIDGTAADRPAIEITHHDVEFTAHGFILKNPALATVAAVKVPQRLEVEATGIFTDRYSPVERIDGMQVTLKQPAWDNNSWGYDTLNKPFMPDQARLFLVNAPEFFGKRGEWHLNQDQWYIDPAAGKLYVKPRPDADITAMTIILPRLEVLVAIGGSYDHPIRNLTFQGLRFSHTSWMGPSRDTGYANQQSGAYLKEVSPLRPVDAYATCGWGCPEFESMRQKWDQIPGAVQVSAARDITFTGNTFSQLGQVALGIGNDANAHLTGVGLGTDGVKVLGNRFAVIAGGAIMAGGVRVEAHHPADPRQVNRDLTIADNVITDVARDYKDNAAVLATYIDRADILHNDISDANYDGIAIGWGWGYNDVGGNRNYRENQKGYLHNPVFDQPTVLRNMTVAGNRIHGVKKWFFDGGAIYNLSANPGTVIRDNHVFDIADRIGIYLDEGSKHLRVEGNVVETNGYWLNANTVGKNFAWGVTADNAATGNWHNSSRVGGRWRVEIGMRMEDDHLLPDRAWPAAALAVIRQAGPRPGSDCR